LPPEVQGYFSVQLKRKDSGNFINHNSEANMNYSEIIREIEKTLQKNGFDYKKKIEEMLHMKNIGLRKQGKQFSFNEHIEGLLLSLLSSQRPWGPIQTNMETIREIFHQFSKSKLLATDPDELIQNITGISCGNRAIKKQMYDLKNNILLFEKIESKFGSLDAFVTSDSPDTIAKSLSDSSRPYKLKQVGYALAFEYLRNVGIDAVKPDIHIRRILGRDRLGLSKGTPTEQEAIDIIKKICQETGHSMAYLDALLWNLCATNSAAICQKAPKCEMCQLAGHCQYSAK
jgi:endonuclease III